MLIDNYIKPNRIISNCMQQQTRVLKIKYLQDSHINWWFACQMHQITLCASCVLADYTLWLIKKGKFLKAKLCLLC